MQYNGKEELQNDRQSLGNKRTVQFFLNLGVVKFHRHSSSVCWKKCLWKVLLCCLRMMKVKKRFILHLNTNIKVGEANKKDKLSIKQIVAKFNDCKTHVYEIL